MLIGKDARPWTHAALFGALWGCMELSLGTLLQLGRVPLKGFLMGSLGMLCLVALRSRGQRRIRRGARRKIRTDGAHASTPGTPHLPG